MNQPFCSGNKVLIVDDMPEVRMSLKRCLTRWGYEVHEAADGQEAFELLKTSGAVQWLAVITDYNMPKMSGVELIRSILNAKLMIGGIMLHTGSVEDDEMSELRRTMPSIFPFAIAEKPISVNRLKDFLQGCLPQETPEVA